MGSGRRQLVFARWCVLEFDQSRGRLGGGLGRDVCKGHLRGQAGRVGNALGVAFSPCRPVGGVEQSGQRGVEQEVHCLHLAEHAEQGDDDGTRGADHGDNELLIWSQRGACFLPNVGRVGFLCVAAYAAGLEAGYSGALAENRGEGATVTNTSEKDSGVLPV